MTFLRCLYFVHSLNFARYWWFCFCSTIDKQFSPFMIFAPKCKETMHITGKNYIKMLVFVFVRPLIFTLLFVQDMHRMYSGCVLLQCILLSRSISAKWSPWGCLWIHYPSSGATDEPCSQHNSQVLPLKLLCIRDSWYFFWNLDLVFAISMHLLDRQMKICELIIQVNTE